MIDFNAHPPVQRVVALGASNLTRGFHTLVATSRAHWGRDVEVVGALGHGRSYGATSRVIARTIPGILESGLWAHLVRTPPRPTRALVTDVGNDILYGHSPEQTLAWVEEAIDRLRPFTRDITLTGLPLAAIQRLSPARFLFFRTIFFPNSRLTFAEVAERGRQVSEGLVALAARGGHRFLQVRDHWYGADPIHIRPSRWRAAWHEILCADEAPVVGYRSSWREGIQLYLLAPERQRVFGVEQVTPQTGLELALGARVWLF